MILIPGNRRVENLVKQKVKSLLRMVNFNTMGQVMKRKRRRIWKKRRSASGLVVADGSS